MCSQAAKLEMSTLESKLVSAIAEAERLKASSAGANERSTDLAKRCELQSAEISSILVQLDRSQEQLLVRVGYDVTALLSFQLVRRTCYKAITRRLEAEQANSSSLAAQLQSLSHTVCLCACLCDNRQHG